MSLQIARRIQRVKPSPTLAMTARANALKAEGKDVISLSVGEPDFDTPAHIYFKDESVSPAGSHKPNSAVPQAFYNKQAGVKRLTTETGAGQWGTSLSFGGSLFGIDVTVFQVRVSYDQKPYRRAVMETYGARCVASPSNETNYGRSVLEKTAISRISVSPNMVCSASAIARVCSSFVAGHMTGLTPSKKV